MPVALALLQVASSLNICSKQIVAIVDSMSSSQAGFMPQSIEAICALFATIQDRIQTAKEITELIRARHEVERVPPSYAPRPEDHCPICLEGPPEAPLNFQAVCNHAFHHECLKMHFERAAEIALCPVCRVALEEDDFDNSIHRNEATEAQWIVVHERIETVIGKLNACQEWFERLQRSVGDLCVFILLQSMEVNILTEIEQGQLEEVYNYKFCEITMNNFITEVMDNTVASCNEVVNETARELTKYRLLRYGYPLELLELTDLCEVDFMDFLDRVTNVNEQSTDLDFPS